MGLLDSVFRKKEGAASKEAAKENENPLGDDLHAKPSVGQAALSEHHSGEAKPFQGQGAMAESFPVAGVKEVSKGHGGEGKYAEPCSLCGAVNTDKKWAGKYWHKKCMRKMKKVAKGML